MIDYSIPRELNYATTRPNILLIMLTSVLSWRRRRNWRIARGQYTIMIYSIQTQFVYRTCDGGAKVASPRGAIWGSDR